MYLEELEGKTIAEVQTYLVGNGCYMMELRFTDGTIFKVGREHSEDHYLEWEVETS